MQAWNMESSTDAGMAPDAGRKVDASVPGLLFLRGPAGSEVLFYKGESEVALSEAGGRSYCQDRAFCDLPPSPNASRIIAYDFLPPSHAIYFQVDAFEPANNGIFTSNLVTGERTLLSSHITWTQLAGRRAGWLYSFDRSGSAAYFSIETPEGFSLFGTDGSNPLHEIAHIDLPESEQPIESRIIADGERISWTVEVIRERGGGFSGFAFHARLFDLDGRQVWGPSDLSGREVALWPVLAGSTFAYQHWPEGSSGSDRVETAVIDTRTNARCDLERDVNSFMVKNDNSAISFGGRYLWERHFDTRRALRFRRNELSDGRRFRRRSRAILHGRGADFCGTAGF